MNVKEELKEKGYCVIPNILSFENIRELKEEFNNWKNTIPNYERLHKEIDPHGIHKYFEAGHTRFAWLMRINPKIQNIFKDIWNCDELIVSFDGSCYMPKHFNKRDNIWTHTDQAPSNNKFSCVQSFMSLTDNKEKTFVVYEGTHNLHNKYFKDRKIESNKNWHLIDHKYLEEIKDKKKVLNVKKGSLVLWDSRTFHQNQYGKPNSEERIVQYICYLPKSHNKNTKSMKEKRMKYFETRRTTSHWPSPINVNGKQPQLYGDESKKINYDNLVKPKLDDLMDEILKLL